MLVPLDCARVDPALIANLARTAGAERLRLEERLGTVCHDDARLTSSERPSRPHPSGSLGDPLESSPRKSTNTLSEPSNFLMFLRLRRGLGLGARRTRPARVRAAGGLNEKFASRHAALLNDASQPRFAALHRCISVTGDAISNRSLPAGKAGSPAWPTDADDLSHDDN